MAGELVDALRIQQKVNVSAQGSTSQGCASCFSFICPHSSHYIYSQSPGDSSRSPPCSAPPCFSAPRSGHAAMQPGSAQGP